MSKVLYDDKTYVVTQTTISTPTRYYPIANATARIRRDLLWIAAAATGFGGMALSIYGDLLTPMEISVGGAACLALFAAGSFIQALSIDAVGHKRIVIVGSAARIRRLFAAVRMASNPSQVIATEPADDGM